MRKFYQKMALNIQKQYKAIYSKLATYIENATELSNIKIESEFVLTDIQIINSYNKQ